MKVAQISTFINGGAGIAAYRIHESLLENNVDSHFFCLDTPVHKNYKSYTQIFKARNSLSSRIMRKGKSFADKYLVSASLSQKK